MHQEALCKCMMHDVWWAVNIIRLYVIRSVCVELFFKSVNHYNHHHFKKICTRKVLLLTNTSKHTHTHCDQIKWTFTFFFVTTPNQEIHYSLAAETTAGNSTSGHIHGQLWSTFVFWTYNFLNNFFFPTIRKNFTTTIKLYTIIYYIHYYYYYYYLVIS